jgi:hypothetical protein
VQSTVGGEDAVVPIDLEDPDGECVGQTGDQLFAGSKFLFDADEVRVGRLHEGVDPGTIVIV